MKILFAGDYSNLHACLAAELRRRGHEVTVVSDGGAYMNTPADISLCRRQGTAGSVKYLADVHAAISGLRGYDVVQIMDTQWISLRPWLIDHFYKRLRRQNGAMCITLASDNYFYVRACTDGHTFPLSEWRIGSNPTPYASTQPEMERAWLSGRMERHARMIFDDIDAAMAVLPEYHVAAAPELGERLSYTGIPIDLTTHPYAPAAIDGPVRLMLGMKRERAIIKGTDRLHDVLRIAERRASGSVKATLVCDVSYKKYLEYLSEAHVVIDQLYALSPATNALDTMAMGRVVASGASSLYYSFIGEKDFASHPDSGPIIGLDPRLSDDELAEMLLNACADSLRLKQRSAAGRALVEKHNDVKVVADRFLEAYQRVL